MIRRHIIGLTGYPGAGKTTAATYLHRQHQYEPIEGSSFIEATGWLEGLAIHERADYESFHRKRQLSHGLSWLSEQILQSPDERITHVGVRNVSDAHNILAHSGIIIALACPEAVAFDRVNERNKNNSISYKSFQEDNRRQNSDGIFGSHTDIVMGLASYTIDASQPPEYVHGQLDDIVADYAARRAPRPFVTL